MIRNSNRGRVYRRCACRDTTGEQLGARCPKLANPRHGRWAFAVDLPSLSGRRHTMRRCGYPTQTDARTRPTARPGLRTRRRSPRRPANRRRLPDRLAGRQRHGPQTDHPGPLPRLHHQDLTPALGAIRLEELTHHHLAGFIRDQLAAGRGPITLRRCVATLSSALNDAVRHHRLPHNPTRYSRVPRPPRPERVCWTPAQAVTFLRHCASIRDPLTELYEVIMGTGMRKGEALALHWTDVDLAERTLFVRYTLSNINNTTPVFTTPKTRTSHAWIGLSHRVVRSLQRQAERQRHQRLAAGPAWAEQDLVFTRATGQPLRPEYVVRHLHDLTEAAELPRIRVHDLRHFAATTMLSSHVPLAMASKTMRHSTLSTTTEIYGHLLRHVAYQAVEAIDTALTTAEHHNQAA